MKTKLRNIIYSLFGCALLTNSSATFALGQSEDPIEIDKIVLDSVVSPEALYEAIATADTIVFLPTSRFGGAKSDGSDDGSIAFIELSEKSEFLNILETKFGPLEKGEAYLLHNSVAGILRRILDFLDSIRKAPTPSRRWRDPELIEFDEIDAAITTCSLAFNAATRLFSMERRMCFAELNILKTCLAYAVRGHMSTRSNNILAQARRRCNSIPR
jgi:hypothetical protein